MTEIKLHNTYTQRIEPLKPINTDGVVRMYCCGPTVYNYAHIGNLRTYIFEDILRKSIIRAGLKIRHVMNITDVGHLTSDADSGDDKMLLAAEKEKKSVLEIARKYEDKFFEHTKALNIARPDIVCRATEHITDMIKFVEKLEEKGYAYFQNGNVYFDTSKFKDYGRLSGQNRKDLRHGARVEEDSNKRNPSDFVLWFTTSKFKDQILQWDSKWGRGYPGWHIECSTMSIKHLGERLDIHCGGVDHIAVHHENEIAQSEAFLGHKWCNMWLHGEFLQMKNDEKMSKSKGNFITLDTLIEKGYSPLAYRYLVLTSHYRAPLVFSYENLDAAASAYNKLKNKYAEFASDSGEPISDNAQKLYESLVDEFNGYLLNDLKTSQALALLWKVVKSKDLPSSLKVKFMDNADEIFALDLSKAEDKRQTALTDEISALIEERKQARLNKDWQKSDEIRDLLDKKGVIIKDLPMGEVEISFK